MKNLVAIAVTIGSLAVAPAAFADPLLQVDDPTPTATFTGTYTCYGEPDPVTGERPEYECTQTGYVTVYDDGVEACNGNQEVTRPDDGTPLQGYVWIGPGHAASNPTAQSPGGEIGAGNNSEDPETTEPTGESPCTAGGSEPPAEG